MHTARSYYLTLVGMMSLLLGGFAPSVVVYIQSSRWWLNPLLQSPAWGNKNSFAMSLHLILTLTWIVVVIVQYIVTAGATYQNQKRFIRTVHRNFGYLGFAICLGMSISAIHLTAVNGVAGKVTNNIFAVATGSMIMYHITKGILAIRGKDISVHIWHMCGLLSWTCAPGFARMLGLIPLQLLLHRDSECDITYTSGWFSFAGIACIVGQYLLQRCVIRPPIRFRLQDYFGFVMVVCFDIGLGFIDRSLFFCPDRPLLAQVPGRAWVLQKSM